MFPPIALAATQPDPVLATEQLLVLDQEPIPESIAEPEQPVKTDEVEIVIGEADEKKADKAPKGKKTKKKGKKSKKDKGRKKKKKSKSSKSSKKNDKRSKTEGRRRKEGSEVKIRQSVWEEA